jgi:chromosome segregation ATPase
MTAIEKEIENVRHSPSKGEVLPSFVEHERKSKIHIHHKPSGPAVQSPVLPTKEESDKLKDQLKASETEKQALNEKIEAAETKNQEKTKQLKALRLQASSQTKQLTELNLKVRHIDEYKARIQSLKLQIQEQQDMYKELVDILSNANETGLSFEQELQPKEDEIEELLNQISVVNYRISELKEAKE